MAHEKSVYDFAVERGRGKDLDKLTIISLAAQREGLSYGKYMVKYNYHPPCLEEIPVEGEPRPKKRDKKPTTPIMKQCPQCGEMFRPDSKIQRYCSYDCQQNHNKAAMKKRYKEANPKPDRFCAVCGILLPKDTPIRVVTCSPECRIERAKEMSRLKGERRKERMEGGQRRETSERILPGNPEHRQAD